MTDDRLGIVRDNRSFERPLQCGVTLTFVCRSPGVTPVAGPAARGLSTASTRSTLMVHSFAKAFT